MVKKQLITLVMRQGLGWTSKAYPSNPITQYILENQLKIEASRNLNKEIFLIDSIVAFRDILSLKPTAYYLSKVADERDKISAKLAMDIEDATIRLEVRGEFFASHIDAGKLNADVSFAREPVITNKSLNKIVSNVPILAYIKATDGLILSVRHFARFFHIDRSGELMSKISTNSQPASAHLALEIESKTLNANEQCNYYIDAADLSPIVERARRVKFKLDLSRARINKIVDHSNTFIETPRQINCKHS